MPADMKDAPELIVPKELEAAGEFLKPCAPEVTEIYTKIWTEVLK
jgi:spermidine/putrescine transport system substrate-binding protein